MCVEECSGRYVRTLLPPQSEKELNWAKSTLNAALVREQLKRLLAHPLFTNSKRYPVLLAYAVEQALDGNASELKERTIGVEAFGRQPDYDVNVDPVVRMTAAEVRKRLSQYYYNPDHTGELVIELPVGSYVPSFREPAASSTSVLVVERKIKGIPGDGVAPAGAAKEDKPLSSGISRHRWASIAMALLVAGLVGFGVGRIKFSGRPSNMERFWEPLTAGRGRVTYCLGEPRQSIDNDRVLPAGAVLYGGLDLSDVITLARSIAPLVPQKVAFRVLAASNTGFAQLREGPSVLIGAYDNAWTMRITQDLPFGFEYENQVRRLVDRKSSEKRSWTLEWQVPNTKLKKDYAIVARIHDQVTGQPVIILAGILREGTEAAGELVSNPAYLDSMLQKAPENWDQLNLEAVIETDVLEDHPGPPKVVAVKAW